jgi:phage gp36-like protein
MSYVTNEDIELRLGSARYVQLTDDAGGGSADPAIADEARLGAEGEVDSALAQRYAVPIDLVAHPEAAAVLRSITLDLIEYRLHARRRDVPADVTAKRNAAVEWLARLGRGETALPSLAPISPGAPQGPRAASFGEPRILSRDELSQF